jgi:hypothetical protein
MTGGQVANGIGSAIVMVTSGLYVLVWTFYGGWFRSRIGRFVVMKAAAICLTGVITVSLTLTDFGKQSDWLRYIQAGLWIVMSIAFVHHTRLVWKVNRKGMKHDADRATEISGS